MGVIGFDFFRKRVNDREEIRKQTKFYKINKIPEVPSKFALRAFTGFTKHKMAVISLWRKKTAGTGKGRGGSKVHVCHEGDRVKKDNCLGTRDQEGEELWEVDNYDECTTPGRCCWPLHSVTRSRLGVARRVWGTWRRDAAFPAFIKGEKAISIALGGGERDVSY